MIYILGSPEKNNTSLLPSTPSSIDFTDKNGILVEFRKRNGTTRIPENMTTKDSWPSNQGKFHFYHTLCENQFKAI